MTSTRTVGKYGAVHHIHTDEYVIMFIMYQALHKCGTADEWVLSTISPTIVWVAAKTYYLGSSLVHHCASAR